MKKKMNMKPIIIVLIVVGFLFLLKFQFPHYKVMSNGMSPNFNKGDIILINKFINGGKIKNNDVCVIENKEEYLTRIIGLPDDKIQIINGNLFVNDVEQTAIVTSFIYKVVLGNHPPLAEYDLMLLLQPINQYKEYTASLTQQQAKEISEYEFVKSITKVIHPKGYYYSFSDKPIFNNKTSFNWSRDNFGPITIPKKSYFVIGDNRGQAIDSRYFGFVIEEQVIGKMMMRLYSPNE